MSRDPHLTLESLRTLDAIDRRGSFAAAAEELAKVPSALSYSVQKKWKMSWIYCCLIARAIEHS